MRICLSRSSFGKFSIPARVPEVLGHSLFKFPENSRNNLSSCFSEPLIAINAQVLLDIGYQVVDVALYGLMEVVDDRFRIEKQQGIIGNERLIQVNVQNGQDEVGIESLLSHSSLTLLSPPRAVSQIGSIPDQFAVLKARPAIVLCGWRIDTNF